MQIDAIAGVAGQRKTARIKVLAKQPIGSIRDVVLIEIPSRLAVEEKVPFFERRVDADKRHLEIAAEGAAWRRIFCVGLKIAGRHSEVPVRAGVRPVEDRDVMADL